MTALLEIIFFKKRERFNFLKKINGDNYAKKTFFVQ